MTLLAQVLFIFIFDQELFHLKFTKPWLPQSIYYVSCVNNLFTICNWNLNFLVKDDFYRFKLLEVHNFFHNYDFISICETSVGDTVELPDGMLENYNFVSCNNPSNTKRGGDGLFYKNDLPINLRSDLSFDESIVAKVVFGRIKHILHGYL